MKGWHEPQKTILTEKGIENKAPMHREVQVNKGMANTLREPIIRAKDFDYFMRKFGLTPRSDKRIKSRGKVIRKGGERHVVINAGVDVVGWHEVGHLVTEEITKKEIGSLAAGSLSKEEYAERYAEGKKSIFYESLMAFKITDSELAVLLKFIEKRDIMDEMRRLKVDFVKLKESAPPFNKIPEQERPRALKHYKKMLKQFQDYITIVKKPKEVFANFFAMYNLDRKATASKLPRLVEEWGHAIDRYMVEA